MRRSRPKSDEPNLFALRCEECDRQLVSTASGYLACPNGHGKLIRDGEDGPPNRDDLFDQSPRHCGSWPI